MKEFKVNEYITLKLEDGETNIYIKGDDYPFLQCKYLLVRKTVNELKDFLEGIETIDELAEHLDHSLENVEPELIDIPTETRFWAHCSNMQVWAENGYDMRLLHSNLAFPLLKRLMEIGDPLAKKLFKEEVVKRFLKGPEKIRVFFCNSRGYIDSLTKEERRVLFKSDIEIVEELEDILLKNLKHHGCRQFQVLTSNPNRINSIMWKEGRIVGLNFDCYELNTIPNIIQELKNLEILILHYVPNDSLPDWLLKLKNLKHLELRMGKLRRLPEWIGELTSLEHLEVYHNAIGYIPESIGDLTSLRYLNLSCNNLEGTVIQSIGNLSKLRFLNLKSNYIKKIPESVGSLKLLRELNLIENKLEELPDSLGDLKSIQKIDIRENKIRKIPESLYKNRICNR